ncbi:MAG: zinc-ribbon domain-containing protein [Oscillospiraceae bacterium]|jgi:predicted amidophosphoribosyltransferase|nr:zinc-ribbon domain-containing protein [Oscillospiraceae bacterium]
MLCPNCQRQLADTARFCDGCGLARRNLAPLVR